VRVSKFAVAAAAAALGMASGAQAVPATTDADGRVLILAPLTLTRIADLDFGTIVPSGVSGVVSINATSGARSFAGGVTGSSSDIGNRAEFGGGGSPSQQVIVTVDAPPVLTSVACDTVTVLGITLDGPATRTIDPTTRAFFVGVGGTLQIEADQPEGDYSADFTVTANYQ
jgi:hypothetical protein